MSIIKSIFGSTDSKVEKNSINWFNLEDEKQLDDILIESKLKTVVIFKHSTRCSVSHFALKQFNKEFDIPSEDISPYFLDLIKFREISNKIATIFNVSHQSPQLLVIKNGACVFHTSHSEIDATVLKGHITV
jgi:bacillithiol system protein YtxJ